MWAFLHRFASPPHFYRLSGVMAPWIGWICLGVMLGGLYGGLIAAPPDYQQGESYRIIFVHVPSAWMSMFIYVVMAGASAIALIWRIKLAEVVAIASAPIGASFTFLALVTGSLWGKPMWGAYWVWDARLTSELILLFLYFGVIGLHAAIEDRRTAGRAAGPVRHRRRGEHSHHPLLRRVVAHTAPGADGDEALGPLDSPVDARSIAADGIIVQALLRYGAPDARAM